MFFITTLDRDLFPLTDSGLNDPIPVEYRTSVSLSKNCRFLFSAFKWSSLALVKSITLGDSFDTGTADFCLSGLERLESLDIGTNAFYREGKSRKFVLAQLPSLRSVVVGRSSFLHFSVCRLNGAAGIVPSRVELPSLEMLCIGSSCFSKSEADACLLELNSLPRLQKLDFASHSFHHFNDFCLQFLPQLKTLSFATNCFNGKWDTARTLDLTLFPRLETFSCVSPSLFYYTGVSFSNHPTLREVTIDSNCFNKAIEWDFAVVNTPQLTSLTVNGDSFYACRSFTIKSARVFLPPILDAPALSSVTLGTNTSPNHAASFTSATSLVVDNAPALTTLCVASNSFPNGKEFVLQSGCRGVE